MKKYLDKKIQYKETEKVIVCLPRKKPIEMTYKDFLEDNYDKYMNQKLIK